MWWMYIISINYLRIIRLFVYSILAYNQRCWLQMDISCISIRIILKLSTEMIWKSILLSQITTNWNTRCIRLKWNQESSIKQHHWIILEKNIGIESGRVTSFILEIWLSKMELFVFHHIWRWWYKDRNQILNFTKRMRMMSVLIISVWIEERKRQFSETWQQTFPNG